MLKVDKVENGAVVSGFIDDNGKKFSRCYTFEEDELDGLKYMLYDILEAMESPNKFGKTVISIDIKHGNKYECQDSNCDICSNKD